MIVKSTVKQCLGNLCYMDSMPTIKLIQEGDQKNQRFGYEIWLIKIMLHCTFGKGNQCDDFLAKMGAQSNDDLVFLDSPLLLVDAMGTSF
uniref:Uncharacterized protein n=1 Tax=Medicago truncatula TaxID=3880 RepID=A2Q3U3_MEDTR|nr:hypothetical protein MtrDRAFT_AC155889g22v2 [Medicago truncatula]